MFSSLVVRQGNWTEGLVLRVMLNRALALCAVIRALQMSLLPGTSTRDGEVCREALVNITAIDIAQFHRQS